MTVIRPMVTYGSVVWWSKARTKLAAAKLSGLQRVASLAVTGAISTTPSVAMEILLDIPPLHIFVEREARLAMYRFYHTACQMPKSDIGGGSGLLPDIMAEEVLQMTADIMITRTRYEMPYTVLIYNRDEWVQNQTALTRADSCWYTDGSKTNAGVGAGVYSCNPKTEVSYRLGKFATVFQAEIFAIEMCATRLVERQVAHKSINIFCDSQGALKALGSNRCKSKLVWNCQQTLTYLGRSNRVNLVWIPGHSGIPGNERADSLAKKGAADNFTGPEPVLGISLNMAKNTIQGWMEQRVLQYWRDCPGMTHAKAFINGPSKKRTRQWLELGRNSLKTLTALYTGHCHLRYHLSRMNLMDNSECRLCMEEDETAKHVLCACPAGARIRFCIFGKILLSPRDLNEVSPSQILDFVKRLGLEKEI